MCDGDKAVRHYWAVYYGFVFLEDAHFQLLRNHGLLSSVLTETEWIFAASREAAELPAGLGRRDGKHLILEEITLAGGP